MDNHLFCELLISEEKSSLLFMHFFLFSITFESAQFELYSPTALRITGKGVPFSKLNISHLK